MSDLLVGSNTLKPPTTTYPQRLFVPNGDGSYSEKVIAEGRTGALATEATLLAVIDALKNLTEVSVDTGVPDNDSTVNVLGDAEKSWPVNAFEKCLIEVVFADGSSDLRKISSNTATSITPASAFSAAPDTSCTYRIAVFGKVGSDITHWGGTALTGRDVSGDLGNLGAIKTAVEALRTAKNLDDIVTAVEALRTAKTIDDIEAAVLALRTSSTLDSVETAVGGIKGSGENLKTLYDVWNLLNTQANISLTDLRDAVRGASTKDLTTLETAVSGVKGSGENVKALYDLWSKLNTQLDITQSALRDALAGSGEGARTLADVESAVAALRSSSTLDSVETTVAGIKGSGENLKALYDLWNLLNTQANISLTDLRDAVRGASTKDFSTLETAVDGIRGSGENVKALYDLWSKLNAQLDITNSALRDALAGSGVDAKTLADVVTALANVANIPSDPAKESGKLGDISTAIGATDDAMVEAGAAGTQSAKLRRVTKGLEDLKTLIVLGGGTNVIGKLRLVTANGDEITDDDADAVRTKDTDGVYTTPTHTHPSVGSGTTQALAANANRLYGLFVNDSNETIYLKLGADAVLNQGIRLNANGGSYEMSKKLGNLYTGTINAICASGGKVLLVTEGV